MIVAVKPVKAEQNSMIHPLLAQSEQDSVS